jgi:hypothetical protein
MGAIAFSLRTYGISIASSQRGCFGDDCEWKEGAFLILGEGLGNDKLRAIRPKDPLFNRAVYCIRPSTWRLYLLARQCGLTSIVRDQNEPSYPSDTKYQGPSLLTRPQLDRACVELDEKLDRGSLLARAIQAGQDPLSSIKKDYIRCVGCCTGRLYLDVIW